MNEHHFGTYVPSSMTADRLDAGRLPGRRGGGEHRAELRRSVRSAAEVHLFRGQGRSVTLRGVTRNRSFRGLSVVSDASMAIEPGQPAEAVLKTADGGRAHLAGVVAFARSIPSGGSEIGLRVEAVGQGPILLHDPKCAHRVYPWFVMD